MIYYNLDNKAYSIDLVDEGTLDTVFQCQGVRVRYSREVSADYRNTKTGELNIEAFLEDFGIDLIDEVIEVNGSN